MVIASIIGWPVGGGVSFLYRSFLAKCTPTEAVRESEDVEFKRIKLTVYVDKRELEQFLILAGDNKNES